MRGCLYLSWEIKGVVANLDQGLLHPWVLLRDCRTNTSRKEAPAQGSRYNTAPNILGKEQISHQTVDPWSTLLSDNRGLVGHPCSTLILPLDYMCHLFSKTKKSYWRRKQKTRYTLSTVTGVLLKQFGSGHLLCFVPGRKAVGAEIFQSPVRDLCLQLAKARNITAAAT